MKRAPWTEEQVRALNRFQQSGGHPFCGERKADGQETVLIATKCGWVEHQGGPVTQTWAHDFMFKELP